MTNKFEPETAMALGLRGTMGISEAFTVAPEVVYSPIVREPAFTTNTSEPDTAMATGLSNPVISEAFTVAPEVVYAPTVSSLQSGFPS